MAAHGSYSAFLQSAGEGQFSTTQMLSRQSRRSGRGCSTLDTKRWLVFDFTCRRSGGLPVPTDFQPTLFALRILRYQSKPSTIDYLCASRQSVGFCPSTSITSAGRCWSKRSALKRNIRYRASAQLGLSLATLFLGKNRGISW